MSNEEQDAAILRLVKSRGDYKKRKALLESELRAAGESLWQIGGSLRNVKGSGTYTETPGYILPEIEKAPDICDLSRIKAMLEELKALEITLCDLNRSARELGID
ncbi:MAG: hypothetical protein ACYCOX_12305 [Acidobacteriaceae bacterium]